MDPVHLLSNERMRLIMQNTGGMPPPGGIVPCLLCGKPFIMGFFIGEPDQLCPECLKDHKNTAKVVCSKCKVTICRMVPQVLESGFIIRPNAVLHSDCCNICKPGLSKSTITEADDYIKNVRRSKIIVGPG